MESTAASLLTEAHLGALKEAVSTTMGAICGSLPEFAGEIPGDAPCEGVLGIVAIVGDLSWSLTLGLPRSTAEAVALRFCGFEIPFDSSDMTDLVGELANILAGDVVARLDAIGIRAQMSLPTVARGKDLDFARPRALTISRMRFATPQGETWVGIAVGRRP
jgi:CheY-specific phosphatase CheX